MTQTLISESPIVAFKNWVSTYSEEELSNKSAGAQYAEIVYDQGDRATIVYLLSKLFTIIANSTQRNITKKAENKAANKVKPKSSVWDKEAKKSGIVPANSKLQAYKTTMISVANRRAIYKAKIALEAEGYSLSLNPDFLSSEIQIAGQTVNWGKATQEQVQARFDALFEASFGDFENLIFIQAVLNMMEAFPGKTLNEIANLG